MMYELRPKPGYTWEDLIKEGVNFKNAEIVKVVDGIVVEKYPYTPTIFKLLKPVYPKEAFQDIVYTTWEESSLWRCTWKRKTCLEADVTLSSKLSSRLSKRDNL